MISDMQQASFGCYQAVLVEGYTLQSPPLSPPSHRQLCQQRWEPMPATAPGIIQRGASKHSRPAVPHATDSSPGLPPSPGTARALSIVRTRLRPIMHIGTAHGFGKRRSALP